MDNVELSLAKVSPCLPAVEALVEKLKQLVESTAGMGYELEVRFGECQPQAFKPGTSFSFFNNALHWLETSPHWVGSDDWVTAHEFYYRVERRVVRTSMVFEADQTRTVHMWKQKRERLNVTVNRDRLPPSHSSVSFWPDFRIELSSEELIDPKVTRLPDVTHTQLVRIKHRRSFYYKPAPDGSGPIWRYDFTRCWSGSTFAEAEQAQRSSTTVEPRYEIELELANPVALLKDYTPNHIATSMLLKAHDFYRPSIDDTMVAHRNLKQVDYALYLE